VTTTIRQAVSAVGPVERSSATVARAEAPARQATAVSAIAWAITAVSGLCLAFVAFLLVLSPLQQSRAQDLLYKEFRTQLAAATAPFEVTPIEPGAPIAILQIGSLELRQVVVEGTAGQDLRNGPGHARSTAFPGQPGNAVVMGRSTTYGAPFADIDTLSKGDQIRVVTGQGKFIYTVQDVRRDGDPEPPTPAATASTLTLVTMEGDLLRPSSTVYVDAILSGDAAVAPPRAPVLVPSYEAPMASDTSALLPLVLWLLLLIAAAAFVIWGYLRWGRLQTWVVAAPIVLAAIWGASDSAALLLPNLM
jgi:sortase A